MSEKNVDSFGRFRSKTVGFRVSPEENNKIDLAVALSGMTKQDYIIARLTDREIRVSGNCRIHRTVYESLNQVLSELRRIRADEKIDEELLDNIRLILRFASDLYSEKKGS